MKFNQKIIQTLAILTALISFSSPHRVAASDIEQFRPQIEEYIYSYEQESAVENGSRIYSILHAQKIQRQIFRILEGQSHSKSENIELYSQHLVLIDNYSDRHPEAISDLARKLQFHWEQKYFDLFRFSRAQKTNQKTYLDKVGGSLGILALGVFLIRDPSKAPRYFKIYRHLLPLLGVGIGHTVAHHTSSRPQTEPKLPPAPAQLMRLGVSLEEDMELSSDSNAFIKDFVALASGLAAGSVASEIYTAVRISRAVNTASTPAKINPLVLLGSVAIGLITEYGVGEYIEYREESQLRADMQHNLRRLDRAVRSGDRGEIIKAAESFKKTVIHYSLWLWTPVIQVNSEFQERLDQTKDAQDTLKVQSDHQKDLQKALVSMNFYNNSATEKYLTLKWLKLGSEKTDDSRKILPLSALNESIRIERNLNVRIDQQQSKLQKSLSPNERELIFIKLCEDESLRQREQNAFALRSGEPSSHPIEVLIQGAAVLETLPAGVSKVTTTPAEELLNVAHKNIQFLLEAGITFRGSKK